MYGVLMKAALLHDEHGLRTFAVVLATEDEAMKALGAFAVEHRLSASHFTAIGAFSRVVVAYFDWASKRYQNISIDEQVEVLSFVGDITIAQSACARRRRQGRRDGARRTSRRRSRPADARDRRDGNAGSPAAPVRRRIGHRLDRSDTLVVIASWVGRPFLHRFSRDLRARETDGLAFPDRARSTSRASRRIPRCRAPSRSPSTVAAAAWAPSGK